MVRRVEGLDARRGVAGGVVPRDWWWRERACGEGGVLTFLDAPRHVTGRVEKLVEAL